MSKTINEILRHYNEMCALIDSNPQDDGEVSALNELLAVRADIERALRIAPLTEEEKDVIRGLFLVEPDPPERDRVNRTGGTSGRPRGGTTQSFVAHLMLENEKSVNANNIRVSRIKQRACEKIASVLGTEYE